MESSKAGVSTEDTSPDTSELDNSETNPQNLHENPKGTGSHGTGGKQPAGLFPDLNTVDWYLDPRFQRYWKHYHQVMNWYQKHIEAYQMLTSRLNPGMSYQSRSSASKQNSSRFNPYASFHRNAMMQRPRTPQSDTYPAWIPSNPQGQDVKGQHQQSRAETGESLPSGSTDGESLGMKPELTSNTEEFEMEITDEMVEFFAQSRKHKKERDEAKKLHVTSDGENREAVYVDADKASRKTATTQAPTERPGLRRTQEMKLLYGKGAAMIHGMETAMQMTFDRNTDLLQPKLWPNMPLKIVFS